MEQIQSRDVPFGTEVFVIVPEEHAPLVQAARSRLYDSLSREFPQFRFSLGRWMDQEIDDFLVTVVAGVVGKGWQPATPLISLNCEQHADIVRHLHAFLEGQAGLAN